MIATSGIIATSDPVRPKIVELTRSMSGATSHQPIERGSIWTLKWKNDCQFQLRTLGKRGIGMLC